jgi:hypothetical protein
MEGITNSQRRKLTGALTLTVLVLATLFVAVGPAQASVVYYSTGIGTPDRVANPVLATGDYGKGRRVQVQPAWTYARAYVAGDAAYALSLVEAWNGSKWVPYLQAPRWDQGTVTFSGGGRLIYKFPQWDFNNLPSGYYRAVVRYQFFTGSALAGTMTVMPEQSDLAVYSPAYWGNTSAGTPGWIGLP